VIPVKGESSNHSKTWGMCSGSKHLFLLNGTLGFNGLEVYTVTFVPLQASSELLSRGGKKKKSGGTIPRRVIFLGHAGRKKKVFKRKKKKHGTLVFFRKPFSMSINVAAKGPTGASGPVQGEPEAVLNQKVGTSTPIVLNGGKKAPSIKKLPGSAYR